VRRGGGIEVIDGGEEWFMRSMVIMKGKRRKYGSESSGV
jgi:hypothetical protein